jgi:photosynthetic reaction center cytochrome c subunit
MSFGTFGSRMALAILSVMALVIVVGTFQHPPVDILQRGYRGTGMAQVYNPAHLAALQTSNQLPASTPQTPASGQTAGQSFQNVQVLKDVDSTEFMRLMTDITTWVAPDQGCSYCHAEGEPLSSDKLYTKVVARRMLQMTMHVNGDWHSHVADTGVTCYTCHRGHPVPTNIWFKNPGPPTSANNDGDRTDQNWPIAANGRTSLPFDPFTPFLDQANDVRVVSTTALPEGDRHSIKQTEWTYSLMVSMSEALGVNCTYCHSSRSFTDWQQSTPARVTAYYGIRMVRDLNTDFLDPLASQFPHDRLGPLGDGPKINCSTCHQGVYKPLFGASLLKDYPELAGAALAPTAGQPAPNVTR